ncbi:MAG TPA: hypothetical protein VL091_15045 [Marinobacter sp.]|nr:hypothetical protein [Marinobacter sp.]
MLRSTILRIIIAVAIIGGGIFVVMNDSPTNLDQSIKNVRPAPSQGRP